MTKKKQRIAKENRRNLRLWAEGAREGILDPHIEPYADAMERGWRFERDHFKQVCREFHARIDWRLADHEEPNLPLPPFDPAAELPEPEKLSEEEEARRQARIAVLDDRIRRWLKYRVKRLRRHTRTRINSKKDPWAILLAKLSGFTSPPKALQAYQQMMHEDYFTRVAPVVQAEWAKQAGAGSSVPTGEPNAPFRALIARQVFAELSKEVQAGYATRAKAEAATRRVEYEEALNEIPSKNPVDRHRCIENLGTFVSPILQGIHERTGLHAVLILGGPIPKYGGDLRTIHISYGRNRSAVSSHFPHWAKERFNGVLSLMKEYLGSAFTKQEMEDAALPAGFGLEGAKFTISPDPNNDDDSDDSNASDSSSDSDSSESEDEAPARKRAKKSSAKEAKAAKAKAAKAAVATKENGSTAKRGEGGKAAVKVKDAGGKSAPQKRKRKVSEPDEQTAENTKGGKGAGGKSTPKKRKRGEEEGDEDATPGGAKRGRRDGEEQVVSPTRKSRRLAAAVAEPTPTATSAASAPATADTAPAPTATSTAPNTAPTANTTLAATSAASAPATADTAPAPTATSTATSTAPNTTPTGNATPAATSTATSTAPNATPAATSAASAPDTANAAPAPTATSTAPAATSTTSVGSVGAPTPSASAAAFLAHIPVVRQGTTATPNGVEVPAECPPWLRDIVRVLSAVDLGCHFQSLLTMLMRLECKYGSEGNLRAGLSTAKRPAEVQAWIRAGRGLRAKGNYDAGITDLGDYAKRWTAWWDSLQPTWRKRGTDGQWVVGGSYGDEWDTLWFPGQNGCASLVASLYFWGASKQALGGGEGAVWNGEERAKWDRAVQDVVWVVEGLENAVPAPKGKKGKGKVG
ncbi:hypothetical protein B0H11DRAFT_2249990 [Mycena galericulata]|nr:hypothetical protein B0H11DRAFT_2249990 [Mycena galericulata]